jgi:hypothetical protein
MLNSMSDDGLGHCARLQKAALEQSGGNRTRATETQGGFAKEAVVAAAQARSYVFRPYAQQWRSEIIKIMVLLHSAAGADWQSPPKGTSLKTLSEAEEQGFILIRGEFQKRQFRLTELGSAHVEHDKRRLEARRL